MATQNNSSKLFENFNQDQHILADILQEFLYLNLKISYWKIRNVNFSCSVKINYSRQYVSLSGSIFLSFLFQVLLFLEYNFFQSFNNVIPCKLYLSIIYRERYNQDKFGEAKKSERIICLVALAFISLKVNHAAVETKSTAPGTFRE